MRSMASMLSPKLLAYNAYTLYLFTISDMKTIQVPITIFAAMAVPKTSLMHFAHAFFWTWLNLLQFTVSNQSLNPAEDAKNKPYRPIPAGRLTQSQAKRLRWALLPLCLALSYYHGILPVGMFFALGVLLHNEMKYDSQPFTRNALNAFGYATFDYGATMIARSDGQLRMDSKQLTAHYLSTLIVFTTIHAQDFQDIVGDIVEKRRTIPIVLPTLGRLSMPIALTAWSIYLSMQYSSSSIASLALISMGAFVGWRFWYMTSAEADRRSYLLYNVWLSLARIIPMFSSSGVDLLGASGGILNSTANIGYLSPIREMLV